MFDVDYSDYLSVDNGRGLLLSREDVCVLEKYRFDYKMYTNLSSLIFDIDYYLSDSESDMDDLEEVLIHLSEIYYYKDMKK